MRKTTYLITPGKEHMRQFITLILLAVGLLSSVSYAAGPVMHIALGQRWLAIYAPNYTEEEKKLFLLGTVFPDIRYLGVIKRSQSHFNGVTLEKVIQTTSPFQQGVLFHSFVDEYREKYVRQKGIEKKITEVPRALQGTFLKLIEDQIIHEKNDWTQFQLYLTTIPDEEKAYGIDTQSLTQWHTGLTFYFSTLPSFILTQVSLFDKGILTLDAQTVKDWSLLLPKYASDPVMLKYVEDLLASFDATMSKKKGI